ncbi:hypothetical protein A2303_06920 [Candidatus Falkowbacteria bacterium RIFOXYB2_FULL_47_14]|uniref:Uncharacterized protein n=1 Tax=Candidatus Falkowbacteria bacterium RIFOXYA2_FULL_47_19 TaxID=1797994 RepID=A0A1F5SG87_9BACT|nr:MAG: hypothetical protein A2227_00665 [Candidatus Falkowbacteria bacterium RIFOXYA2_FULL_47_19]OGF35488.1 MAG: hypothetical protein A2468_05605 [Candidatus Falkowbacteria bacterium RIFOXYC2_FULL_46_15]OGF43602.1 MAG: hypothetical protein A2303_06920 [Candidatus Falkowbacteria bacterium RIFOXYB2_FULL_47_14]
MGLDVQQFVLGEILETIMETAGGVVKEKTREKISKTLEAKFGGFGPTDEILSLSACQIAQAQFNVSTADIIRIANIFKSLSREERNKITSIIGRDEQVIDITSSMYKKGQNKKQEKEDREIALKMNLRGAALIVAMSKMTDEEILNFLAGFGALDTTSKNILEMIRVVYELWNDFDLGDKILKPLDQWAGSVNGGNLKEIMAERRANRDKTITGGLFRWFKNKGVL